MSTGNCKETSYLFQQEASVGRESVFPPENEKHWDCRHESGIWETRSVSFLPLFLSKSYHHLLLIFSRFWSENRILDKERIRLKCLGLKSVKGIPFFPRKKKILWQPTWDTDLETSSWKSQELRTWKKKRESISPSRFTSSGNPRTDETTTAPLAVGSTTKKTRTMREYSKVFSLVLSLV